MDDKIQPLIKVDQNINDYYRVVIGQHNFGMQIASLSEASPSAYKAMWIIRWKDVRYLEHKTLWTMDDRCTWWHGEEGRFPYDRLNIVGIPLSKTENTYICDLSDMLDLIYRQLTTIVLEEVLLGE